MFFSKIDGLSYSLNACRRNSLLSHFLILLSFQHASFCQTFQRQQIVSSPQICICLFRLKLAILLEHFLILFLSSIAQTLRSSFRISSCVCLLYCVFEQHFCNVIILLFASFVFVICPSFLLPMDRRHHHIR